MKKILYITPFVPSERDAGTNFSKQLIEKIAEKNRIDLFYFKYSEDDIYKASNPNINVLTYVSNNKVYKIFNAFLYPILFPLFTVRFNWFVLLTLYRKVCKTNYDIIYFDFSQTFLYAKFLKCSSKVLMSHDVIFQRFERKKSIFLWWVLKSECFLLHTKNAHIFTFSQKDTNLIAEKYKVPSIPTNFFISHKILEIKDVSCDASFVMFAMWKRADNYIPLQWLMDNVFPYVSKKIKIIGGGLSKDLKTKIENFQNVEYLGFLDNPYPLISSASALLAPLFSGAGVKVKVVESLACGTPVLGTKIAFEGIDIMYSDFMIHANSANDYINLINNFAISSFDKMKFREKFLNSYSNMSLLNFINNQ